MPKILVVDDEESIVELIKFSLEREGYEVITARDGLTALERARAEQPELVVLDVMLPGKNGLDVCRALGQESATRHIPVIMVSARSEEVDRILGLEMGADDYISKPFSPRELAARVKARLRRKSGEEKNEPAKEESGKIKRGKLVIDQERFSVMIDGVKQDFTLKEFELLRFLARHQGKVFSRDFLLEKVWGYDYVGDSRTVDVHIRHIRQKLEVEPGLSQSIETVRGVGYRFREAKAWEG